MFDFLPLVHIDVEEIVEIGNGSTVQLTEPLEVVSAHLGRDRLKIAPPFHCGRSAGRVGVHEETNGLAPEFLDCPRVDLLPGAQHGNGDGVGLAVLAADEVMGGEEIRPALAKENEAVLIDLLRSYRPARFPHCARFRLGGVCEDERAAVESPILPDVSTPIGHGPASAVYPVIEEP